MSRKLSLAVLSCMALVALGAFAPSAYAHDPGCNGNNLSPGTYNDALEKGKFDLSFANPAAHATTAVNGGAILCGTSDEIDRFYENGTISYPNRGEIARCARPNSSIGPCTDGNIDDGRYTGSATSDVYCNTGGVCALSHQNDNVDTETHVAYDTTGPGPGVDHCDENSTTLVGCFETEAQLVPPFGPTCNSDVIITKDSSGYRMKIHQPTCNQSANPTYFDTIDDLTICEFAGAVNGNSCGTDPNQWLNENGDAGAYTFKVSAFGHSGTHLRWVTFGTADGSWT